MGVVTARLVFLAFLGLTGTIIYNALYLQEHGPKGAPATAAAPKATTDAKIVRVEPMAPPPRASVKQAAVPDEPTSAAVEIEAPPPVSTDLPPLAPGTGESQLIVRAVQRELASRGYDVGPVDGSLSDKTRAAITAYQTSQGLTVTGLPSDELLRQILLGDSVAPAAATGSLAASGSIAANAAENATVKRVQQILADLGYAPGPIDGAWGANTASAVSAFQGDRGIVQTGQITPELLNEFQRVTGRDLTKTAARP
jgi:peptidoglycan hydrolase-like protein with peptidoglycan-binding domain